MKILTDKKLQSLKPCDEGYAWWKNYVGGKKSADLLATLLAVNEVNPLWARWTFTQLMNTKRRCEIAIYAAEQVLPVFEAKYPGDKRPRMAIKAAVCVLKHNTKENQSVAAAYSAADAAADAAYAAADAAYAAADAAYSAAYSAYSDADAAADAAYSAACAAAAARTNMQVKIIKQAAAILNRSE